MKNLIIYTPQVSGSRHHYYNELSKLINLTIVSDVKTPEKVILGYEIDERNYKHFILEGFSFFGYMSLNFSFLRRAKLFYMSDFVILEQYATPTAVFLALLFNLKKKEFYYSLDGGHSLEEGIVKYFIKKTILGLSNKTFVTGVASEAYLRRYKYSGRTFFYPISSLSSSEIHKMELLHDKKMEVIKNNDSTIVRIQILYVGRICLSKGIDFIARQIYSTGERFDWVLIGEVSDEVSDLVIQLELLNNVTILPFMNRKELLHHYASSDIFLSPSRQDTWNYTVLEGLSSFNIVITSDNTGVANSIFNRYLLVYDNNNYESFNRCFENALSLSPIDIEDFSALRETYTLEKMAERVYMELIGSQS